MDTALARYERRRDKDRDRDRDRDKDPETILISFQPTSDKTFEYSILNNIPGFMWSDEYEEWIAPFHSIFMRTLHKMASTKGIIAGSNIEIKNQGRAKELSLWFHVIYLGQEPDVGRFTFMVKIHNDKDPMKKFTTKR